MVPQARPSEEDVKAAYIFNFGKFVRYTPTNPQSNTFDLCVLGQDSISQILEKITINQHIDERVVQVKRFENAGDARGCAIVFMGQSEASRLEKDLAALQGSDALTISDVPQFMVRGGMLELLLQGNRVRFAVNLDAVNRTNLQVSSELLRVAVSVSGQPRREVPQ
jgi:YfiR/HmsC-like